MDVNFQKIFLEIFLKTKIHYKCHKKKRIYYNYQENFHQRKKLYWAQGEKGIRLLNYSLFFFNSYLYKFSVQMKNEKTNFNFETTFDWCIFSSLLEMDANKLLIACNCQFSRKKKYKTSIVSLKTLINIMFLKNKILKENHSFEVHELFSDSLIEVFICTNC